MIAIEVGKPFPMALPPADGAVFEIGPDGDMNLVIRMDGQSDNERTALKAGFERYSIYVGEVVCWVFKFPAPVGYLDAPFHSGLYTDNRVSKFLANNWNALNVYVVDLGITQVVRLVGLRLDSVALFRGAVGKQSGITPVEYNAAIDRLYRKSSEDIFRAGTVFRHAGEC